MAIFWLQPHSYISWFWVVSSKYNEYFPEIIYYSIWVCIILQLQIGLAYDLGGYCCAGLGKKPPDESAQKTDFSALSLTGRIVKGVFKSDDLNLQAPALRVGGKGKANLNNDTVDYLVKAKLVDTLKAQQAGSVDDLSGLLIPVRIKGPFTDPKIDVQLDEMLKAQSKAKIAQQKAKLKAQIAEEKAALIQRVQRV